MRLLLPLILLGLTACAPVYTPNPGNPYDFQGDLNNLGGPAPAAAPKQSWLDALFG